MRRDFVGVRATLHVVSFCLLLFVFLPPLLTRVLGERGLIAPDRSWRSTLLLQVAGILGLSAAQEFASRGRGTPCPLDPPRRLVVSGPYAYVANPMQVCKVLCLFSWGVFLGSGWLILAAVVYLAATALWTGPREDGALERRFGEAFRTYRSSVRRWWPRGTPYPGAAGRLYVAKDCAPCDELERWLRERSPHGLEILPASSHPSRALARLTYESGGVEESGLAAFARAAGHLHLGWAFVGWALRLPGVRQVGQILVDAVGGGPRSISRNEAVPEGSCPRVEWGDAPLRASPRGSRSIRTSR